MNEVIENIFKNFTVDNVKIPVSFLYYNGHSKSYVTYNNTTTGNTSYGDDKLEHYVEIYDFDIYSKGNYLKIVEGVKNLLEQNDFIWEPSMTSADLYEEDTGYFHKTLSFARIIR